MKNNTTQKLLILLVALVVFIPQQAFANAGKALQSVGRIVSSAKTWKWVTAIGGSAAALKAMESHLAEGEAVYAVGIDLNNKASSVNWADFFSRPDVFPVLMVAGVGTYVIPEIWQEYSGGKIIWTFKIPRIPDGTDIALFILDDDSGSDRVWKKIVETRWNAAIDTNVSMTQAISCNIRVNGSIKLDTTGITIDSPDTIANYNLKTPKFYQYIGGDWDSEGELKDGDGRIVGHIVLSQLIKK